MSVQRVWEVGGTVFSSLKAARELINATSPDDVQPQAVLAAEAIGQLPMVSPQRIDEAIGALEGNESLRIEHLKATIGLNSGNIRALVRKNTALIRFFLLCAACKLCYVDEHIGEILFAMLVRVNLLDRHPVSTSQLQRLVTQLSGHANAIIPTALLKDIASRLYALPPAPDLFSKKSFRALAELLVELFQELHDESNESIKISGYNNGVWLATTILWLLGEDACLFVNDRQLHHPLGDPAARVIVNLELPKTNKGISASSWTLTSFKHGQTPSSYVFTYDTDERDTLHRLPLECTVYYFDQYYWTSFEGRTRSEVRRLCGVIAEASLQHLVSAGRLRAETPCCKTKTHSCNFIQLDKVVPSTFLADINNSVQQYGWSAHDLKSQTDVAELLTDLLKACEKVMKDRPPHQEPAQLELILDRTVENTIVAFLQKQGMDEVESTYILDPALHVALDAVLTCTARFNSTEGRVKRFIRPLDDAMLESNGSMLVKLLAGTATPGNLHDEAVVRLLPGVDGIDASVMIAHYDGLVAGMSCLWTQDFRQDALLRIDVMPGDIRKDGHVYGQIRELPFQAVTSGPFYNTSVTTSNNGESYQITNPIKQDGFSFATSISASGNRLGIKHYLLRASDASEYKLKVKSAWMTGIFNLAVAHHVTGYGLPVRQERELSRRVFDRGDLHLLRWLDPLKGIPLLDGQKIVVPTWRSNLLRMTVASALSEAQESCSRWYILNEGSMMELLATNQESDSFVFLI